MNNILQSRLTNLTSHLTALTESITSYNPSPHAASLLLHEDALLSADLETLAAHQRNVATLERLRATTQKLDEQMKDSLRALADTRKELISQRPREDAAAETSAVDVNTLLNTAMRIAKYTVPPSQKQKPVPKAREASPAEQQTSQPATANVSMNTNNTQSTELATQPSDPQTTQQDSQEEAPTPTTRTRERIPEHLHAWIDPPKGADGSAIWTPWPNENVIKAGALGKLQWMAENEVEPDVTGIQGETVPEGMSGVPTRAGAEGRRESAVLDEQGRAELEARREEARRKADEEKRNQEELMDEFDLYDPDEA
ncbi:MAG: hypothetical protein Q9162_004871 [Coniocarpon cinnabarinum]